MEQINFLNTKNHTERQTMHRWFYSSCIILTTLLLCVGIIHLRLYAEYQDVQKKLNELKPKEAELSTCLTQKRDLRQKTNVLKNQLAKTNRIKRKPKNPAKVLKILTQDATNVDLHTIQIDKKNIALELYASKTDTIIAYANNVRSNKKIVDVDLGGIEQTDGLIKATITIVVK